MLTTNNQPLVSCIMPTYNRRGWIRRSIDCFLSQEYDEQEFVIVDDGTDLVGDLVPADPRIRYHRLDSRLTIGAVTSRQYRRSVAWEEMDASGVRTKPTEADAFEVAPVLSRALSYGNRRQLSLAGSSTEV